MTSIIAIIAALVLVGTWVWPWVQKYIPKTVTDTTAAKALAYQIRLAHWLALRETEEVKADAEAIAAMDKIKAVIVAYKD